MGRSAGRDGQGRRGQTQARSRREVLAGSGQPGPGHVLHDALAQGLHLVFILLGVNVLFPLPVIGAMPRAQRLGWWLMSLFCAMPSRKKT